MKPPRVADVALRAGVQVARRPCSFDGVDGAPMDGCVVFGKVVGVHIDEKYIKNGLLDTAAMRPIARGGYHDYSVLTESFA